MIYKGNSFIDDRGSVKFINDFHFDNVVRFYQVENHERNFIRAWHGHEIEEKYVYVPKGAALVAYTPINNLKRVNPDANLVEKVILTGEQPQILYIPEGMANGFKTLQEDTIVQFFSTLAIEDAGDDDIRFEYDILDIWRVNFR